jgi:hypothetical protein
MKRSTRFKPGISGNQAAKWKPGQSGNPAGKSKLRLRFEETFNEALITQGGPEEAAQLLWPGKVTAAQLESLKTSLGSYRYAGQYQQRPAPASGGIFKRYWFRYLLGTRSPGLTASTGAHA